MFVCELSFLCHRFLFEVQLHAKVNKMNVENLATVMGINLLKPQIEDPITVMKGESEGESKSEWQAWVGEDPGPAFWVHSSSFIHHLNQFYLHSG